MTSSGSGSGSGSGDHSPAPPRAVVDGLLDVRARAAMLQTMFGDGSPTPPRAAGMELVEGMLTSVTSALSALNTGIGGGGGASSSAGGRGSGERRKKGAAAVAGPIRRSSSSSSCRRRTLSPFLETVTTNTLDDGHAWRKYGQKLIQNSENPRSYYRCTHMPDQGCKARKQVQVSDTNPSEYTVSYFGQHTCRDPSTVPIVIEAAVDAPTNSANFISFGGSTTVNVPPHLHQAVAPTMFLSRCAGYSSSLPAAQERCGSEEAISGISPPVMGSKGRTGAVGSAPEYDMLAGGIDTGSFPSSPSSLGGFVTGSFGSFGDDDCLFGFDP